MRKKSPIKMSDIEGGTKKLSTEQQNILDKDERLELSLSKALVPDGANDRSLRFACLLRMERFVQRHPETQYPLREVSQVKKLLDTFGKIEIQFGDEEEALQLLSKLKSANNDSDFADIIVRMKNYAKYLQFFNLEFEYARQWFKAEQVDFDANGFSMMMEVLNGALCETLFGFPTTIRNNYRKLAVIQAEVSKRHQVSDLITATGILIATLQWTLCLYRDLVDNMALDFDREMTKSQYNELARSFSTASEEILPTLYKVDLEFYGFQHEKVVKQRYCQVIHDTVKQLYPPNAAKKCADEYHETVLSEACRSILVDSSAVIEALPMTSLQTILDDTDPDYAEALEAYKAMNDSYRKALKARQKSDIPLREAELRKIMSFADVKYMTHLTPYQRLQWQDFMQSAFKQAQ